MPKDEITAYLRLRAEQVDREIKKYLTDKASTRYLEALLGRSGYEYDTRAIDHAVLEPARYLLDLGGKRWRSTLMLTIIDALGKDSNEVVEFAIIPEVIHNGTLIHDDIEDSSETRRGAPAVHIKYGTDVALNLGDFMFYLPMIALLDSKKVGKEVKIRMLEIYQREMLKLSIGQATDIAWHRSMIGPEKVTEAQYLQMAYSKTGVLASMAAKMGAAVAGADDKTIAALGNFGATIGVAFQLQDDVLNLSESELSDLKGGVGDDITEGKITLLAIKTFEKADKADRARLSEILKMHTRDQALIKEAVAIIKKYGAEEYIKELEFELLKKAWAQVDGLLPASDAKKKLKGIAEFLVNRTI
jgi:geranylgeranyl diphosphate synthase, type I